MEKKFMRKTYINREYSWLKFNERVLDEATCESNPLLEKGKFLSIFTSNLDEFCMVRLGSLYNDMFENPKGEENKTSMTPSQQLNALYRYMKKLYPMRTKVVKQLFGELKKEGINIQNARLKGTKPDKRFQDFFKKTMRPLLNPIVLDNKNPLIHLDNLKMYVLVELERDGKTLFGLLPVPARFDRLIAQKTASGYKLITIEDLTYHFASEVFSKYKVVDKALVRLTRNADFDTEIYSVDYESEYDFSKLLKGKVDSRASLAPVRLELSRCGKGIREFLCKHLGVSSKQCFRVAYFFDYKFLFSIDKFLPEERVLQLKYPPFKPRRATLSVPNSVLDSVLKEDIFLSYPFDSIDTYLELLDEASVDPRVAGIKITLYRVDKQSRVIEALRRASRNGKDVTVIIELAARFDEENNLHAAGVLKDAGCTVSYGVGNYKVHSKITLILLKEGEDVSFVTHLGTGNYNEGTAKQYTDLNVLTANPQIGADASDFFTNLAMSDMSSDYRALLVAPTNLKSGLLDKIKEQSRLALEGKPASIICKMNSLTDLDFIKEFQKASCAGVKVQLIVRGICCLTPGIEGKTENITVKSIIGRFLEHSRIYCFGTDNPEIYISSADLMTRNVSRRVEIATPILCPAIKQKVQHMLNVMLQDNEKATYLTKDGDYVKRDALGVSSQQYFLDNDH